LCSQNETSQTECKECTKGKYASSGGQEACSPCPPGTYTAEDNQVTCQPCASGKFNGGLGATKCEECGVGSFSKLEPDASVGASVCELCDAGSFSNKTGPGWGTHARARTCVGTAHYTLCIRPTRNTHIHLGTRNTPRNMFGHTPHTHTHTHTCTCTCTYQAPAAACSAPLVRGRSARRATAHCATLGSTVLPAVTAVWRAPPAVPPPAGAPARVRYALPAVTRTNGVQRSAWIAPGASIPRMTRPAPVPRVRSGCFRSPREPRNATYVLSATSRSSQRRWATQHCVLTS
jgi:hypothetical protein